MVERVDDLNLPNAVVSRLMKESLPDGISISKEAKSCLSRSASVFVLYLTATAVNECKKENHKTMTAKNVLDALEEIDFENFIEPLKAQLESELNFFFCFEIFIHLLSHVLVYRKTIKDKKDNKKATTEDKEDENGIDE